MNLKYQIDDKNVNMKIMKKQVSPIQWNLI